MSQLVTPRRTDDCAYRAYPDNGLLVVIDHVSQGYFVFEGVARDIWELLDGEISEAAIAREIADCYAIDPDRAHSDVTAFLGELAALGLLYGGHADRLARVANGAASSGSTAEDTIRAWATECCIPYEGVLEVTALCNERCVHCYLEATLPRHELTTMELCRVLDELAELGCLRLTFTGGEIFARSDILEILRYARLARHFEVHLLTNATRISDAIAVTLRALGIQQVSVSVYSATPEEHDEITRHRRSHAKTLRGIRALRGVGIEVTLNCPIMRGTTHVVPGIIALARDLGADYTFDPYLIPRRGAPQPTHSLALTRRELGPLLRHIAELTGDGATNLWKDAEHACSAGRSTFSIGPTGDVYPCLDLRLSAGNCRAAPLAAIWKRGAILEELREPTTRPLECCQTCVLQPACKPCYARAYHDDGDFYGCASQSRLAAEMQVDLARRP